MTIEATNLAARTSDAFSVPRYASWKAVALMLLRRGFSPEKTEEIMRSKVTRWAADESNARYGYATSRDVARYLDRYPYEPEA